MDNMTTEIPAGYRVNGRGDLVREENIKEQDKLQDELVMRLLQSAQNVAQVIATFKSSAMDEVDAFVEQLAMDYDTRIGGRKGNLSLISFDGLNKVQVQIADNIEFGAELVAAEALCKQCLDDWSEGANVNLMAVIDRAFNRDKEGKISRTRLIELRRVKVDDERWSRAMQAVIDAERVVASKSYIRFYRRDNVDSPWTAVPLDAAKL